jgi:hypothetical protein
MFSMDWLLYPQNLTRAVGARASARFHAGTPVDAGQYLAIANSSGVNTALRLPFMSVPRKFKSDTRPGFYFGFHPIKESVGWLQISSSLF